MITREIDLQLSGAKRKVAFPLPVSTRWLDAFLKLRCARDLLEFFRCDNPAQEVSESMAALGAASELLPQGALADEGTTCLVPGDGFLPRTGALVAHRTRWQVVSVDPNLRDPEQWPRPVRRLEIRQRKIEGMTPIDCETGVILAVHSHAALAVAWDKVRATKRKIAVALPCCTVQEVPGLEPIKTFRDLAIMGTKNEVLVWDTQDLEPGTQQR